MTIRVCCTAAAVFALVWPMPNAAAQAPVDFTGEWTWAELRTVPGVGADEVAWMEANVPIDEARRLLGIAARLSAPADVQLLARNYALEMNAAWFQKQIEPLTKRPPDGPAGTVRVAYLAAQLRRATQRAFGAAGYPMTFAGRSLALPPARPRTPDRGVRIRLQLDFAPADSLLAIISTRDISPADAERRIATPAFDAMIQHRTQSMYSIPLTRKRLAMALSLAASTSPVDELYRYANPIGLLHFADVASHAREYRTLISTMRASQDRIVAMVADSLAPFLPAGAVVERTNSFYFGDGADGWGVVGPRPVFATDLEYVKDDYPRFLSTTVHESYHSAQDAVRRANPRPARAIRTRADSTLSRALGTLWVEGTANYVAPSATLTDSAAAARAAKGATLVANLFALMRDTATFDATRAQEFLDEGTAGGGPFYWLGAAMSRLIDERLGREALVNTLKEDGITFFLAYQKALDDRGGAQGFFDPALVTAVRRFVP